MWLINVDTLQLEYHIIPDVPFAILSHTWGRGEVSFQEFKALDDAVSYKEGFSKIVETCRMAKFHNLSYAWVDTCCIDKSSSAELSEAINSMFRWYQLSTICFAYLVDVYDSPADSTFMENFSSSRWFTRGWTLQELIAPKALLFYNASWQNIGSKHSLVQQLQSITGIYNPILTGQYPPNAYPVGKRMSWACKRQTTRVEDMAYCLLGIFDINMPLLYGEGEKAFARLQTEIIQETNDLSLLAWTSEARDPERRQLYSGVLAISPADFAVFATLSLSGDASFYENDITATRTVLFTMAALQSTDAQADGESGLDRKDLRLPLRCSVGPPVSGTVSISVVKTPYGYLRLKPWSLHYGTRERILPVNVEEGARTRLSVGQAGRLKLRRHISLKDSMDFQDARFYRADFVRFNVEKNHTWHLGGTFTAFPDAIWDGSNQAFLCEMSQLSPRILRFSLIPYDLSLEDTELLLVSIEIHKRDGWDPERWVIILGNHQDSFGKWVFRHIDKSDASAILSEIHYAMSKARHSPTYPTAEESSLFFTPCDDVATPNRPACRMLQTSDGMTVKATVSILPSDKWEAASEIVIALESIKPVVSTTSDQAAEKTRKGSNEK
ncbi:Vegetative incompatibility protein HET-E-1 [Colletotrichum sidae]|uniref:Vegetative incompatibility protein HET-E-1 n=1 Tax=Colletotrichum sidae TaxID=1347389 RepID=A0A4R8TQ29_9PEZI|nr:Vegetative incompatibility protein HET-E-1 [Colletotrichum sidae]